MVTLDLVNPYITDNLIQITYFTDKQTDAQKFV